MRDNLYIYPIYHDIASEVFVTCLNYYIILPNQIRKTYL